MCLIVYLLLKLRLKFDFKVVIYFEEPVARISSNGFSMGILTIYVSLSYSFIFYILIYIYLVTMCKNNGKK